jgi:hypothetical protein
MRRSRPPESFMGLVNNGQAEAGSHRLQCPVLPSLALYGPRHVLEHDPIPIEIRGLCSNGPAMEGLP